MGEKYLVTGGAGFIGSHLVESLLRSGHSVRVLDDFSTGRRENLAVVMDHPGFELMEGDIRDPQTVRHALASLSGIFHLAAFVSAPDSVKQPRISFEINAGGTFNVLEAARLRGPKRIVLASTAAVYGNCADLPCSESAMLRPVSPYGLDKLYGEQVARLFHQEYGLEPLALRLFNVYGPRQDPASPYSGVITKFIDCLRNDVQPIIFGDGHQTRDFVFVDDVVRACLAAMGGEYRGFRCYNVGSGENVSINALFSTLRDLCGKKIAPRHTHPRAGDLLHTRADIRAIRSDLGYAPEVYLPGGLSRLLTKLERD